MSGAHQVCSLPRPGQRQQLDSVGATEAHQFGQALHRPLCHLLLHNSTIGFGSKRWGEA